MQTINVAFFTKKPNTTVLEHLRVAGPLSYTDINLSLCHQDTDGISEIIEKSQLIVIQRDFPTNYDFYLYLQEISKDLSLPIVYDLDDNLFELPPDHPDRRSNAFAGALMPMLEAAVSADYLTVSNNFLKERLSPLNKNIFVLPNYLDERIWQFKAPKEHKPDQKMTIGYMGSASHIPDMEMIGDVLVKIKAEFAENLHFHFYGAKPPEKLADHPDTTWTPVKTFEYEEFAQDFQQLDADLFIAPLVDNTFNRCKSPIKFFEYTTMGVPGIFSRLTPYEEIITDGKHGLLAGTPQAWEEKIRLLIQNPELRHDLAVNAQKLVQEKYLMSQNSEKWAELYQNFIKWGITDKKHNQVPPEIIKNLTPQLTDFHHDAQKKTQNISSNLDQIRSELKNFKDKNKDLEEKLDRLKETILANEIEQKELKRTINSFEKRTSKLQKTISSLEKERVNLRNRAASLENEKINLQGEVSSLEQEVLFYALSKSWRITRPLRKLKKLIKG